MPWFSTKAHLLIERYKSITEIIADPQGEALAFAQDMNYVDWVNFQIKNFIIRKKVLNQPVRVDIDRVMVSLVNPDTKQPLLYQDFITDRSGPKFGGYLYDGPGTEYLTRNHNIKKVIKLIKTQKERTINFCEENNIPQISKKTLSVATSTFKRKHPSQRRLSDYDLTALDTDILERAILAEVEKKLTDEQVQALRNNPNLRTSIGKTAWQKGGRISTDLIIEFLNAKVPSNFTYSERVLGAMIHPEVPNHIKPDEINDDKDKTFIHFLILDVGEKIRDEYLKFYKKINVDPPVFYLPSSSGVPDTSYGLGIPFYEASISKIDRNKIEISTHHEDIEIGDIICDNSSIFGKVFNPNNNFKIAQRELNKEGISNDVINKALIEYNKVGMDQLQVFERTLKKLIDQSNNMQEKKLITKILKNYENRQKFIGSGLIFEECGKKEAQSQLFRRENKKSKLIGNISDTGIFVSGVRKAMDSKDYLKRKNATIHQQMAILTTLISITRWGVNHSNYKEVTNTHAEVTPQEFMDSLNGRSYKGEPSTGIRKRLNLNSISLLEATERLNSYERGFNPIWKAIQSNGEFFQFVDQYRESKEALKFVIKKGVVSSELANKQLDFQESYNNLRTCLDKILISQMPELSQKLDEFVVEGIQRQDVVDSIMTQLEEAIDFGTNRELLAKKNEVSNQTKKITPTPEKKMEPAELKEKRLHFNKSMHIEEQKLSHKEIKAYEKKLKDNKESLKEIEIKLNDVTKKLKSVFGNEIPHKPFHRDNRNAFSKELYSFYLLPVLIMRKKEVIKECEKRIHEMNLKLEKLEQMRFSGHTFFKPKEKDENMNGELLKPKIDRN
ncbi:TPA: hypothetical protein ACTXXA_003676 [Legionella anisa]